MGTFKELPGKFTKEEIRRQYDEAFQVVWRNKRRPDVTQTSKLRPNNDPAEIALNSKPPSLRAKRKLNLPFTISKSTRQWNQLTGQQKRFKKIRLGLKKNGGRINGGEKSLYYLLDSLYPTEWAFVGSGGFSLNGLRPDFLNEPRKQLIELFGEYWHTDTKYNRTEEGRAKIFGDSGYSLLVIWCEELKNVGKLSAKIKEFVEGK